MITSAAVRAEVNGEENVFKVMRHSDFFLWMKQLHCKYDKNKIVQGFIDWDSHTGEERFVSRSEAARIALKCNQIKDMKNFNPNCLYSEDCW